MSSNSTTPTTGIDWVKYAITAALLLGGLAFFLTQGQRAEWMRWLAVIVGLVAGFAVFLTSSAGAKLVKFGREAYIELGRITWPERRETLQMTLVVFGFVIVMALVLWLLDKSLEWVFFDLILDWRK